MITCDNINTNQIREEKLFVIWVDIRNSTNLNKKYSESVLYIMYKGVLNKIYELFEKHGFSNIDIQGDGLYAVSGKNSQSVLSALYEINEIAVEELQDPVGNEIVTISVHFGEEIYGCFGGTGNQMAFFGGIVTDSKKWISNSLWVESKKTRLIMSKKAHNELIENDSNLNKKLNISLKGNKKNKKYKGYYE